MLSTNSNNKVSMILIFLILLTVSFGRLFTFEFHGFTAKPVYFASIALIIYLSFLVLKKKVSIKPDFIEVILYLFVFQSFLGLFWSIDPIKTLVYSMMLLFMALIFSAVRRLAEPKNLEFYFTAIIWLSALTALFGIWQFFGDSLGYSTKYTLLTALYTKQIFGFPRVQSTFFEPGFYANFLMIPIFLNIYRISYQKKYVYFLPYFVTLLAFFLTLSRGGYYSLAAAAVIFAIIAIFKFRHLYLRLFLILALTLIVFFLTPRLIYLTSGREGIFNFKTQTARTDDFFKDKGEESEVGVTRSYTINIALKNWKKTPFGIGSGAFGSLPEFAKIRAQGNLRQTVNSIYPEILVEQGIQGFILFLLFAGAVFLKLFKTIVRDKKYLSLIFMCGLLAILIQFISFSTLYLVYIWVFLAFALVSIDKRRDLA